MIGIDLGRVIRVIGTRELPPRASAQLRFHERTRPRVAIHADELYVLDVQSVEYRPDVPGADDPVFLHGVLRGPYPQALVAGVRGVEGRLATTRAPLLHGLSLGIERSFAYESGRCGTTCTHAVLPLRGEKTRSVVLAFPLVPMGDDGSNELVTADLIRAVLGAMRADLGDDLSRDPVPVSSRRQYERALIAAGWKIEGDRAVRRRGRSRLAALFLPTKKRRLPREVPLAEFGALIDAQLARIPGWSETDRRTFRRRLGVVADPQREHAGKTHEKQPKKTKKAKKTKKTKKTKKAKWEKKWEKKKRNREKIKQQNELRKKRGGDQAG
ncbi:MAG: hypothetical protein AB7T06_42125 [Kofleriaceae bacterium]